MARERQKPFEIETVSRAFLIVVRSNSSDAGGAVGHECGRTEPAASRWLNAVVELSRLRGEYFPTSWCIWYQPSYERLADHPGGQAA
jgi:hypothetical protein